jgi:TatD DNase family protein
MDIVDTHCHIHEILGKERDFTHQKWAKAGVVDADQVIAEARAAGVTRLVCVGCDVDDSALAVEFVQSRPGAWASIGIHPHEAKRYASDQAELNRFAAMATANKVVAVGECGLDYFYEHSPKAEQLEVLHFQLELAQKHHLPLIFHVRDAFDDFWPVFDQYKGVTGVVHSFTADKNVLEQALSRDLCIGLNGIMTFTKDQSQLAAAKAVPAERVVIETDAPYLTPTPYRGTINVPKHARTNLEFVANLLDQQSSQLAAITTENALRLFNLV